MQDNLAQMSKYYNMAIEFIVTYSMQILSAIIILIIGIIASKYIFTFILKMLQKYKIDETLSRFIANFVRILVVMMMGVLALGKIGISIAPFVAAIGALSLTAGLALQGSVANFAAGIVLILTKPFKIGDTITVHDIYGEVVEIKLAYCVLYNEDKEQITIPNKYMIGDVLVNSFEYRIVEGSIGIAYDSNIERVIEVIQGVLKEIEGVSQEYEAIVGIEKFSDSSIDIAYRYWVPSKSYFKTQYGVNLQVMHALQVEEIEIPFPQREIRIKGEQHV